MANLSSGFDKCIKCTGIFNLNKGTHYDVSGESQKKFICVSCDLEGFKKAAIKMLHWCFVNGFELHPKVTEFEQKWGTEFFIDDDKVEE